MGSLSGYEVLDRLGVGGVAEVYRASKDGQTFAIKRLRPELAEQVEVADLFATEGHIGMALHHPNIVRTCEARFDDRGHMFLVMEYIHGRTLAQVLEVLGSKRLLAHEVVLHIVAQVLHGLHCAHELRGQDGESLHLIHRDVSPENVFLSFEGHVKLSDFGVAGLGKNRGETAVGKLPYMAPEQLMEEPLDRRIDVYAVGVMLYELLTGVLPFAQKRRDDDELVYRIVKGKYPAASKLLPAIAPVLDAVIARGMATRREQRYPTALAMAQAVEPLYRAQANWAPVVAGFMRQLFDATYTP